MRFGTLRDVRVIGYYNARDVRSEKQCVVYVIEVAHVPLEGLASPVTFMVYRRYSQIAILASKLHFHPSVGLPPKYALQPFPLTEEQLSHRYLNCDEFNVKSLTYEGLRHFVEEVFLELRQAYQLGKQHDIDSTAGLDMQTYCDFISSSKNKPPPAAIPPLPSWAIPVEDEQLRHTLSQSSGSTWADVESFDSEEFGEGSTETQHVDYANAFRNDVLQVEGQIHALSSVIQVYVNAANAMTQAAFAVEQELSRLGEMQLLADDGQPYRPIFFKNNKDKNGLLEVYNSVNVLEPLTYLCNEVFPDIKDTFWSQSQTPVAHPTRRIMNERMHLKEFVLQALQKCDTALNSAHTEWLTSQEISIQQQNEEEPLESQIESIMPPKVPVSVVSDTNDVTSVYVWGRIPDTSSFTQTLVLRPTKQTILPGQAISNIASGGERLLYLTVSGDVYSCGPDEEKRGGGFFSPHLIEQFALDKALHDSHIIAISCGTQHALAISQHGELYTWGSGEDGRLGHGDIRDRAIPRKVMSLLSHRVTQASCGGAHTAVVTADHKLFTFGRGKNGRLGLGPEVTFKMTPEPVSGEEWTSVYCGWNFTVGLTINGKVFCWGKQGEGQCGLGYANQDQYIPVLVQALIPYQIVQVACGYTHTLALSNEGEVFSWGLGEYGQLGKGSVYQPVPELVDMSHCLGPPDLVTAIYCGAFHSIATTRQNVMLAWGLNMYGACGLGHVQNRDTPERLDCFDSKLTLYVACGHKFTVAIQLPREFVGNSETNTRSNSIDGLTPSGNLQREEELRRAKKLWRNRILRNWNDNKDTPLAQSLWRQGIPPSIRSTVWPLAIGNGLKITPDMYNIYRQRATKARTGEVISSDGREHTVLLIHTDLPRTFPSLKLFDTSGPYFEFLREVLETYACYRPDLGYIQGMSYIAALLCLHIPTDRYLTFQCLANVMVHEHLFTFYLLNADLSNVYYKLFDECFHQQLPDLHEHLTTLGIQASMYLMNWLQTLFLQVLPLEVASRVFDCFLLDGVGFLFRTALAIQTLLSPKLLRSELEEALPLLQRHHQCHAVWTTNLTEERLFDTIATIGLSHKISISLDHCVQNVYFYQAHLNPESALFPTTLTRRRSTLDNKKMLGLL
ncbi:regulator of chromosome condensation (RCC1) [Thraustotheca clavata]|uniref:Regulator of chromosome condensation (RCC1) n=1 Tax=Thraustotheca clavata TaxID=74557 RepID=A0A1V9ZY13_9STRA|nr:regulator of chromosome condensation (RCC1) [Thraustotheca clavata]